MELLEKVIDFYRLNRDATKAGMIPIGQLEELGEISESSGSVYLLLTRREKHSFKVVRVDETNVNPKFQITKGRKAYGHYNISAHSVGGFKSEPEWDPINEATPEKIREGWDDVYRIKK